MPITQKIKDAIAYIASILPSHYEVHTGQIGRGQNIEFTCKSDIGLSDKLDDNAWARVLTLLNNYFGSLYEVVQSNPEDLNRRNFTIRVHSDGVLPPVAEPIPRRPEGAVVPQIYKDCDFVRSVLQRDYSVNAPEEFDPPRIVCKSAAGFIADGMPSIGAWERAVRAIVEYFGDRLDYIKHVREFDYCRREFYIQLKDTGARNPTEHRRIEPKLSELNELRAALKEATDQRCTEPKVAELPKCASLASPPVGVIKISEAESKIRELLFELRMRFHLLPGSNEGMLKDVKTAINTIEDSMILYTISRHFKDEGGTK